MRLEKYHVLKHTVIPFATFICIFYCSENYLYVGFESGFLLQLELTLSWASEKTPAILDELNRVHASNKPLKKLMVFEGILLSWDGGSLS